MKQTLCAITAGVRWDDLNAEQQAAINSVFTQYVLPMPGTRAHNGTELVDGLVDDAFDPAVIADLGLPLTVLAIYHWDGHAAELTPIVPLTAAALLPYLPDVPVYDEAGNQIGTEPPEPRVPHNWAGLPQIQPI